MKSANQRALFWRCYRALGAFIALAVIVPGALIIPAHHGRLQEQALEGATKTIEALSLTIAQAFAGGNTGAVEQQIVALRRAQPGVGLAFVTGWTGKIVAHSDPREVGKLFVDLVPPPVNTATRSLRRSDGSSAAEVTVPLHVNGDPRGAFRAEIGLPAIDRQALHMLFLFAALGGTLLGVAILVASQMARALDSPYSHSLERLVADRAKAMQTQNASVHSKEALLRAMTESSPLALLVVDEASGEVRYVNQVFCRLWGCEDLAARLGRAEVDYDEIAARGRVLAGDAAFPPRHGRPAVDQRALAEDELSLTDGRSVRRFSVRVSDDKGGYLGRMFIFEDVTAHKRAESQLGAARDAALAESRSKSALLATMSHELRTPMQPLIGMTELLLGTSLNPAQRDYADSVRQSAEGLLTTINDIIDFSKIEAGQLELEITGFDLHSLVEGVVDLLGEAAHRKGLELACWIDPEVPRAVEGDPARLRQVLLNLIGNAVKFTERGEVVLAVHTVPASGLAAIRIRSDGSKNVSTNGRNRGSDNVTLRFEIKDTGIGIAPEQQPHLFQPVAASGKTTAREIGSGLGLVISNRLVAMMGGDIGVESARGHGSLFWFTAVLRADLTRADDTAAARAFDGNRLLVVDDNATARALLERQLDAWGLPHDSAASGGEGLKRLRVAADRGTPYTLALVDLEMPSMDGGEMSRIVSNDPQLGGLRLLLLTPAGRAPAERAREATVAGIVTKPVRASRLYEALVSALL